MTKQSRKITNDTGLPRSARNDEIAITNDTLNLKLQLETIVFTSKGYPKGYDLKNKSEKQEFISDLNIRKKLYNLK